MESRIGVKYIQPMARKDRVPRQDVIKDRVKIYQTWQGRTGFLDRMESSIGVKYIQPGKEG